MKDERVNRLIARRNKLTNRRDERINRPAVAEIDAQLREVPAGTRNDVDLLLGRTCATLPPRADYGDRAAAIVEALEREEQRKAVTNFAGCAGNSADEYDSSTEGHW